MRLTFAACALFAASLLSTAAQADTFNFKIVGGGDTFTFSIDPANTPSFTIPGATLFLVSPDVQDVNSFGTLDLGPFVGIGSNPGSEGVSFSEIFFTSPDIFNGTTFSPGAFVIDLFGDPSSPYSLTISAPAVPEPTSLVLLASGALGVASFVRRRVIG